MGLHDTCVLLNMFGISMISNSDLVNDIVFTEQDSIFAQDISNGMAMITITEGEGHVITDLGIIPSTDIRLNCFYDALRVYEYDIPQL